MKNVCLFAVFGLVTCAAVEFERQQPLKSYQVQETNYDYNNYGEPVTADEAVPVTAVEDQSLRTHHGKHKLKKKLKKQLLHCLLQQHGRRRRDATGRFFIPLVSQNTNVNVGGDGGPGTGGYGGQYQQYGGGCMQMFNGHGPLGSFSGAFGSPATEEDGNRAGTYAVDWNRYARQFRRNVVRPLYRLF